MTAIYKRRTHCLRGHEYNRENTRIYKKSRVCKLCKKYTQKVRRQKIEENHGKI